MKILVDTHLLLWSTIEPGKLSSRSRTILEDIDNDLFFSSASIWEIVLKASKPNSNIKADARLMRDTLLSIGYVETAITSEHALHAHSADDS